MGAPGTYSITKYGWPSGVEPASNTLAIEGWSMMASDCRSDWNRWSTSSSNLPTLMSFNATCRRTGAVCSASHTCPMPPSPILRMSRYGPMDLGSVVVWLAPEPADGAGEANSEESKVASGSRVGDSLLSMLDTRVTGLTFLAGSCSLIGPLTREESPSGEKSTIL